jgi:iron complex outermembrane receptor protein
MRFFNRKLTLNPTLFYYDYTNFQVSQFTGISSQVVNAPKATVKGFELEVVFAPDRHFSFNSGLTILDATYGRGFSNLDTLNPALGMQDLNGNRLDRAPKLSGSFGAEYRTAMTKIGRLAFRGDIYASSRVYYREFNETQDSQAPYALVNLALIWDSSDGRYNARVFAKNIGNEQILAQLGSSDFIGSRFATYAPPRQIGAEARVRF